MRVKESRVWPLELEAVLVAKFELLQYFEASVLFDVFQVLEGSLGRWVALFLNENGLELLVEIELVQFLQFLLHEPFFLGLRTALRSRLWYELLTWLLESIFLFAFHWCWQLDLFL